MKSLYIKKTLLDKEFCLYELLKIKKKLETQFLRPHSVNFIQSYRFKLKLFLITRDVTLLFNNDIARLIINIELLLGRDFPNFKYKGEHFFIKNISSMNKNKIPPFFNKLIEYNEKLEKYNANLIVQGSFADSSYLSYSDVDLVIIGNLSKNIIKIKESIEQELTKIDPLQHHGVFFINTNSFKNYWQMDLPIATLKKSILLSYESTLNINVIYSFKEKYSSYNWIYNFMNKHSVLPITLNSGAFYVKYFISQLLLVPALFLAFKGNYVYKKESFELAKKYYNEGAWRCIEIASTIREKWNQKHISENYILKRKSTAIKSVEEYNTLTEVINFKHEDLIEFRHSYLLFIEKTNDLLI